MAFAALEEAKTNDKMLYIGKKDLEHGTVYDVDVFSSKRDEIIVNVSNPRKTLRYGCTEDYLKDWARSVKATRWGVEVHFASGNSMFCKFVSEKDKDDLLDNGFEHTRIMMNDSDHMIRVNPKYVEWYEVRKCV